MHACDAVAGLQWTGKPYVGACVHTSFAMLQNTAITLHRTTAE